MLSDLLSLAAGTLSSNLGYNLTDKLFGALGIGGSPLEMVMKSSTEALDNIKRAQQQFYDYTSRNALGEHGAAAMAGARTALASQGPYATDYKTSLAQESLADQLLSNTSALSNQLMKMGGQAMDRQSSGLVKALMASGGNPATIAASLGSFGDVYNQNMGNTMSGVMASASDAATKAAEIKGRAAKALQDSRAAYFDQRVAPHFVRPGDKFDATGAFTAGTQAYTQGAQDRTNMFKNLSENFLKKASATNYINLFETAMKGNNIGHLFNLYNTDKKEPTDKG